MALHRPLPVTLAAMFLVLLFLLLDLVQATISISNESESPRIYQRNAACRLIPGDAAWPKDAAWSQLNKTVNGRLIATVPVASICHDPKYEANTCGRLKKEWSFPQSHMDVPAEILTPYFQGQFCNPFTAQKQPCTLGNYAVYSINVTGPLDVQEGIRFAREHNIRLTIKNTGHDFLGKSTGKGALSLWTHNLKSTELISNYKGDEKYSGQAMKLGAGVTVQEVLEAAGAKGVRSVVGTCATVGVSGGYTAGGGHGLLTSLYGLAADNVLEWEVVTAGGKHVIAKPSNQHSDLYWALSGGGAGTFGVVLSVTIRVYPEEPISAAATRVGVDTAGGLDKFWHAVAVFQSSLGSVVDAGAVVAYLLTPTQLLVQGIVVPNAKAEEGKVKQVIQPVIDALAAVNVSLPITQSTHKGLLDLSEKYFFSSLAKTPQAQITGGRMVPRSLVENITTAETVTKSFRAAADQGFTTVCVAVKANRSSPLHANAVFPLWRNALLHCFFAMAWDFTIPWDEMLLRQEKLTHTVMPPIEAATPGGGAYLSEANFQQPDWQAAFYGSNYPRLSKIKELYDPLSLFYARTAVGSEKWAEDHEGRLCPRREY